ncbi:hypothetical protein KKG46_05130 [Patescibacteria group bacterium]|nr:hypothetical protein [Patescibacteria group bacterium]
MQNAPFIRLHKGHLELWYWYPDSIGHKVGYQFNIRTQDGQNWRMEVFGRATCGMSTRLDIRLFFGNESISDFIQSACRDIKTNKLITAKALLLETNGFNMLRDLQIEIRP